MPGRDNAVKFCRTSAVERPFGAESTMQDTDAYRVHSPWGAIAAFFLVQCFGFVTLQGFRMFVNIGVRGSDELNTIFVVQGWEVSDLLSWDARSVLHDDVRLPTLVSVKWKSGGRIGDGAAVVH